MFFILLLILLFLYCSIIELIDNPVGIIFQKNEFNRELQLVGSALNFDALPIVNFELPDDVSICHKPLKITSLDQDCTDLCQDPHAIKKKVTKEQGIYYNNNKLLPGYYCMLNAAKGCNEYTTILVYSSIGWTCIPRFAEFQGLDGCDITVCKGSIYDVLTESTYVGKIPYNLVMTSPEETLPNDNTQYRFQCSDEYSDVTNNTYVGLKHHHLMRYENPCTLGIDHPIAINYDFDNSDCDCRAPLEKLEIYNLPNYCVNCKHGMSIHTDKIGFKTGYTTIVPCFDYRLPQFNEIQMPPCNEQNCIEANITPFKLDPGNDPANYVVAPTYRELVETNLTFYKEPMLQELLLDEKARQFEEARTITRTYRSKGLKNYKQSLHHWRNAISKFSKFRQFAKLNKNWRLEKYIDEIKKSKPYALPHL